MGDGAGQLQTILTTSNHEQPFRKERRKDLCESVCVIRHKNSHGHNINNKREIDLNMNMSSTQDAALSLWGYILSFQFVMQKTIWNPTNHKWFDSQINNSKSTHWCIIWVIFLFFKACLFFNCYFRQNTIFFHIFFYCYSDIGLFNNHSLMLHQRLGLYPESCL